MKTAQHVQTSTSTAPNGAAGTEEAPLPAPVDHFARMGDSLRVQLRAIADSYTAEMMLRGYEISSCASQASTVRLFLDYVEGHRTWRS